MLIVATTAIITAAATPTPRVLDICSFGAIDGLESAAAAAANQRALNAALAAAAAGDTVLIPAGAFYTLGGVVANGLVNVTVDVTGSLIAAPAYDAWPVSNNKPAYANFVQFSGCEGVTLTGKGGLGPGRVAGGGLVDGRGVGWWNREIFPHIFGRLRGERPRLIAISDSRGLLIERLTLLNSPTYHLLLDDVAEAEVRLLNITVDRAAQRDLKHRARQARLQEAGADGTAPLGGLEPEDLNTDGIDPSGQHIWVHDSLVANDDDSIAVKPCAADSCVRSPCSQHMLFERLNLTGFGASVGSVPPHAPSPHCVNNVTFRSIRMIESGKGIYIKSNPECGIDEVAGAPKAAIISNILYEDILIDRPRWWAIWIGPQQQHEPHSSLGLKCALDYPLSRHCPTQGCVTFANITLRNVHIERPLISPGVIKGNATSPITGLAFDNVTVSRPGRFPFGASYECEHASGRAVGSSPPPACLLPGVLSSW